MRTVGVLLLTSTIRGVRPSALRCVSPWLQRHGNACTVNRPVVFERKSLCLQPGTDGALRRGIGRLSLRQVSAVCTAFPGSQVQCAAAVRRTAQARSALSTQAALLAKLAAPGRRPGHLLDLRLRMPGWFQNKNGLLKAENGGPEG